MKTALVLITGFVAEVGGGLAIGLGIPRNIPLIAFGGFVALFGLAVEWWRLKPSPPALTTPVRPTITTPIK